MTDSRLRRIAVWGIAPAVLLILNIWVAVGLFRVEYLSNLSIIDAQFMAMARYVTAHPGDILWWPQWACGLPWPDIYLPLLYTSVAAFSAVSGHSPALSYHQITAAAYALGPVFAYFLAYVMSRKAGASFLGAAAYSVFSPCALLPAIRADMGGFWRLRRFHVLAFYGEGPHTVALALAPLAILFFYLALTRKGLRYKALAGLFTGLTFLTNAYGGVIVGAAAVPALLASLPLKRFWRNLALAATLGALTYCWISPLLPPSTLAAIRMNSPTIEGDYGFTTRSLFGVLVLVAGFIVLWAATRKSAEHLRFFLLFTWLLAGALALGTLGRIYVVPQPHRYQVAADMAVCFLAVFGGAALLGRISPRAPRCAGIALLVALAILGRHAVRYGRSQVHTLDVEHTSMYRMARWMDANMRGARVMIGGAYSLFFNNFTDTPQLHGGNDPTLPNPVIRMAAFTIYSGMNAGARDGEIAILWLKAFGAHAVSVPGPRSPEYYKPFVNPRKFDGLLPVVWHEDDDTVYALPARSASLAHVMREEELVRDTPANGLDTAQLERYVRALESPAYPLAEWRWTTRHSASIRANIGPGQVISVQETWRPGWHATTGGAAQPVTRDGLGFIVVKPACQGPCEITLAFDGGTEWRVTCAVSIAVMLLLAGLAAFAKSRDLDLKRRKPAA